MALKTPVSGLNVGCVPSKALLRCARAVAEARRTEPQDPVLYLPFNPKALNP